jgi:hypothetical protein
VDAKQLACAHTSLILANNFAPVSEALCVKGAVMTVGMSFALRAKQPKQKRCDRCELYYPETLDECDHCSELDNSELAQLKAKHQETLQDNSTFGKYLIFSALIIGLLLLVSFL